jgi:hypothetical protein
VHGLDRAHDVGGTGVLEQEPGSPGMEGAQYWFASVEGGEHDHLGRARLDAQ